MVLSFFLFEFVWATFGWRLLLPLNIILPIAYILSLRPSSFLRGHLLQIINYQLLGTGVMFVLPFIPMPSGFWWVRYVAVVFPGMGLVLIASTDPANAGSGRYPNRIPL